MPKPPFARTLANGRGAVSQNDRFFGFPDFFQFLAHNLPVELLWPFDKLACHGNRPPVFRKSCNDYYHNPFYESFNCELFS